MEFLKSNYNSIAVLFFVVFIVVAHLFASNNYDWTKNTISDLGAQGYEKKLIMQLGFLLFGLVISVGILMNGITWRTLPIFVYAFSVALTGIFCTKPFIETTAYSQSQSFWHAAFAQIAGVAFSIGILIQMLYVKDLNTKLIHLTFFVLVIGLSLSFGLLKNYQGIAQRTLYLVSFIWFIKYYSVR